MRFVDVATGASLKSPVPGKPGALTRTAAVRIGRALATLLARSPDGAPAGPVVVTHADEPGQRAIRDGLVAGLLLAGRDVLDLGAADSELFAFALRGGDGGRECAAGILVGSTGDALSVMVFVGLTPLVGGALLDLARIADAGVFVVGTGVVLTPDLRGAFRAEPGDLAIDIDYTTNDTSEGPAL
jgi:hypothetical protein